MLPSHELARANSTAPVPVADNSTCTHSSDSPALFDWCFAENGLLAHKDGEVIGQTSLVSHLGEENLKRVINWVLAYFAVLDIPVKRGTFVEFRQGASLTSLACRHTTRTRSLDLLHQLRTPLHPSTLRLAGMLNVSPIGRNCSREERNDFEKFDLANKIRQTMVEKMKVEFADLKLTYSIGGQISFDVFPQGWDKTFCLRYLPEADFDEIHFFGDKTFKGGNDFEIFSDPRTMGHSIDDADPMTTLNKLSQLFGITCPAALSPPGSH